MGLREKRETLKRLCSVRYPSAPRELLDDMEKALRLCEKAGTARNDIVHGFADWKNGMVVMHGRGKRTPREVSVQSIKAVNEQVWNAFIAVASAFGALWNTTKGYFEDGGR